MGALIYTAATLSIFVFNALVSKKLAHLATVPWGPLFPFKPFNCDACLTFWFSFIGGMLWAWFALTPTDCKHAGQHFGALALLSLSIAILNYFYIKSKIQINE